MSNLITSFDCDGAAWCQAGIFLSSGKYLEKLLC